jgi:hypothetical protein
MILMAAPQTNGVLRTTLESMNIGDYIKCEYSQTSTALGVFTAGFLANSKNTNTELDLVPRVVGWTSGGTYTSGFFYLIKVATGLLIADRMVVKNISAQTLNIKNYLLGAKLSDSCMVRSLSRAEFLKYISNSDLNGNIIKADPNVWHGQAGTALSTTVANNSTFEVNHDRIGSKIKTSLFLDGTTWDETTQSHGGGYATTTLAILQNYVDPSYILVQTMTSTFYSGFRPVLEYVDNSKSTNLYY